MTIRFQRVNENDRLSASQFNRLVDEVERLSTLAMAGNQSYISTAGGVSRFGKQPYRLCFELLDDLEPDAVDPVEGKQLVFDGDEFQDTGIRKLLYPAFLAETIEAGVKVFGFQIGARWYC